jgi:hypothetical protein
MPSTQYAVKNRHIYRLGKFNGSLEFQDKVWGFMALMEMRSRWNSLSCSGIPCGQVFRTPTTRSHTLPGAMSDE